MPTHAAFLRGVNIGPKKRIAMADLRALVTALGHTAVATHVNSGNVVFTAGHEGDNAAVADEIAAALRSSHGLDVPVFVRTAAELMAVVHGNPFPAAAATPKLLHVTFLAAVPDPARVAALAEVERGDDEYVVAGDVVYLHYPHGLSGATFMPAGLDRALGVVTTSRNWSTVTRVAELTAS